MTDKEKLEAIRAEVKEYISAAHKAHTNITEGNFAHLLSFIDSLQEEPVSEDLEKEIDRAHRIFYDEVGWDSDEGARAYVADWFAHYFANWQKHHMEANRLAHCNSISKEQAELEQKFLDEHLDKYNRMPTFLDAIEYGMRLQKEQIIKRLCNHANIERMVEKFDDKYKPEKVLDTEYYKRGIFDTIKAIKED